MGWTVFVDNANQALKDFEEVIAFTTDTPYER